jgi:predicted nucleic acid-binding protein
MKSYVIDANILLSGFLSSKGWLYDLLNSNRVFVPEYLNRELAAYYHLLKSKRPAVFHHDYSEFRNKLNPLLTIVEHKEIPTEIISQSEWYCRDIDKDDADYVAVALHLNIPLLTRDKKLAYGLRGKGFTLVLLLDEWWAQTHR